MHIKCNRLPFQDSLSRISIWLLLMAMLTPAALALSDGDTVRATERLHIRPSASTSGTSLGVVDTGSTGVIVDGPTTAEGYRWWRVNWDSSSYPTGWSVEDGLEEVVVTPAPDIDSVSPDPVPASNSAQPITIRGDDFQNGCTLIFKDTESIEYPSQSSKLTFNSSSRLTYQFNNFSDAGTWKVKVINPDGKSSSWFSFTVQAAALPAPTISGVSPNPVPASSANQNLTINGANFQSGCTLTFIDTSGRSYPSMASKLTRNSSGQITYLFNNASDAGTWKVKVNNPDGKSSGLFNFTVQVAAQPNLVVDSVTFSPTSVTSGGNFTLGFRVRNIGPGNAVATMARIRLSVDAALTSSDLPLSPLDVSIPAILSGSSYTYSGTVTIPGSTPQGLYYVGAFADFDNRANQNNITDDAGISAARITVNNTGVLLPTVFISPTSQTVEAGGNVTFKAVVVGTGPFAYQWLKNGREYSGAATNSSIVLGGISTNQSGNYACRVFNPAGTVISAGAMLTVTPSSTWQTDLSPGSSASTLYGHDPRRPTYVITHGWGGGVLFPNPPPNPDGHTQWQADMAAAISNRLDRESNPLPRIDGCRANIIVFSWLNAYDHYWDASDSVQGAGGDLAQVITNALGPNYTNTIHFIGHSLGTLVNAFAVESLPQKYKGMQFTILDAPFKKTGWDESDFLGTLSPSKVDWVDNYYGSGEPEEDDDSAFGTAILGAAMNGGWMLQNTGHSGVHRWYQRTIQISGTIKADGFDYSKIIQANGWYDRRPEHRDWDTPANRVARAAEMAAIISSGNMAGFRVADGAVIESTQLVNGQLCQGLTLSALGATKITKAQGSMVTKNAASSNSAVSIDVSIPLNARTLEFAFKFAAPSAGNWMTVQFNDAQLFNFRGESFVGTNFQTAILPVVEYAGQSGTLTFRLNGGGGAASSVALSKFEFKAPLGLTLTPASRSVGFAAGMTTFSVTNTGAGTMAYAASEVESWLGISADGATGGNSGTIKIAYTANPGTTARTGIVTVTSSGVGGGPRYVRIIQAGKPTISITPSTRAHSAAAASGRTIGVTANVPWTATANQSWISIVGGGTVSGNGTVTYNVAANAGALRSGTITVSGGGVSRTFTVNQWRASTTPGVSAEGDFDGDARADVVVFNPATGNWALSFSSGPGWTLPWGWSATVPVPADYDGDGMLDLAVYHPATGNWHIQEGGTGRIRKVQLGYSQTVPVPGDYDNDGKADLAVFHPAGGRWYFICTTAGRYSVQWGWSTTIPVPADYDGDGKTDLAVYHPASGLWQILKSSTGGAIQKQWGWSTALPVPADYNGDGRADVAVFHRATGTWRISYSGGGSRVKQFGWASTIPVAADYDGDGVADLAVYHPATGNWHVLKSTTGGTAVKNWGGRGTIPVLLYPLIHSWFRLP